MTGNGVNPIEIDPFALYAGYPSKIASGSLRVTFHKTLTLADLNELDDVNGRILYKRRLLPDVDTVRVANAVEKLGTVDAATLAKSLKISHAGTIGTLLFLAKYDFLTIDGLEQNNA